ncbi:MAG: ribonuclease P protein component [Victivallaceae bacterium]|nr:ribonuclease P protein component [Victivallaceae bacterium]
MKRILEKSDKLRYKSEFDQVRINGRKAVGPHLLVVCAPSTDGAWRCGVICGRKFSTLAVKRNRARRLCWESFRLLKGGLSGSPCHVALIPRRPMLAVKRQAVTIEMAELLVRHGAMAASVAASPPEC